MAEVKAQGRVLLADDEPFYLEWLDDFLCSKGLAVDYAASVDEAVRMLKSTVYRFLVVDLNLPMLVAGTNFAKKMSGAYEEYPGLYIASAARNGGYRSKQVIIYSVFSSREVDEASSKLYCTYLTKMHPQDLKREIVDVLKYNPKEQAPTPKKKARKKSDISTPRRSRRAVKKLAAEPVK